MKNAVALMAQAESSICVYLNAGTFSQARSRIQQCLANSALDALSGIGQSFAGR
jgi:hypothetical protein